MAPLTANNSFVVVMNIINDSGEAKCMIYLLLQKHDFYNFQTASLN